MKHLLTSIKVSLFSLIGAIILKLVFASTRKIVFVSSRSEVYMKSREEPIVIAFWHGYQIMILRVLSELFGPHPKRKTYALISEHSDGRIIAGAMKYFNLDSIAGSSTRSAKKATVRMIKTLQEGHNVAITPDGPKGPIYEAKSGVIKIAQLSGRPIIPMAADASDTWTLGSWDKMKVPKPFSRISFSFGDPIYISKDLSDDEVQAKTEELKKALNYHSKQAREVLA